MRFHVITLFPHIIDAYVNESVIGRAVKARKLFVASYNPRDFIEEGHGRIDSRPYGGGPGMVLKPEPVLKAIEKAKGKKRNVKTLFFSPSGKLFDSAFAKRLAEKYNDIILISGHYEGVDARVRKITKADAISIGPYTLSGGEVPSLAVIDSVSRFIPGVLGNTASLEGGRTASSDVYTRPEEILWKGKKYRVPKVLLSGHHSDIEKWKSKKRREIIDTKRARS